MFRGYGVIIFHSPVRKAPSSLDIHQALYLRAMLFCHEPPTVCIVLRAHMM